ncbi:hypothetical protein UA08_07379 [Talaromyces atroroseus]|uniref:Methyltransferase n=1 Tax=Talaromyces atroroseus TaxID=1441469 RepID=A0A225AUS2_TALAT|nr:hypothetical protein UA08_07379 [Talaromyces atroroseus]OKL57227.1 hypothetical protein UA08_07379 [Talaromyces atroroseus]
MASSSMKPQDVLAHFTYLQWKDDFLKERPIEVQHDQDPRKTNMTWYKSGNAEIVRDARGRESEYNVDTHGFTFVKHDTGLTTDDFYDRNQVIERYIPQAIDLYKKVFGDVDEVYIFHWQMVSKLRSTAQQRKLREQNKDVHVDQTQSEVERHVRNLLPDRAEYLLKGRVRNVNMWRPVRGPVQNWPLAVCDSRSVSAEKYVEFDRILPKGNMTARMVLEHPTLKWHYLSQQQPDEAIIFKCTDSHEGVAKCVPHASIELPNTNSGTPARESIEIRAYLFSYPKNEA